MPQEPTIVFDKDNLTTSDVYINFYTEEVGEYLLKNLLEDINEILRVTKIIPSQMFIYVSPSWKKDVFVKGIAIF
jgi:hypothetical protein